MTSQNFTSKQLTVFGQFLKVGYAQKHDLPRLAALFAQIKTDLDFAFDLAFENRILTNLVALVVETPSLYALLNKDQKAQFQLMYMENWRRSELIKRQLLALSAKLGASSAMPLVMIKGGLRVFDDLYPKAPHRLMSDIDLYFCDTAALKAISELGYQSGNPEEFDITNFTQEYLDWHATQNHHLPPVFAPGQPCHLEMHQHLVHRRAIPYCRAGIVERSIEIPGLAGFKSPTMVDQMILNLLHAKYGDMYTDYSNFRLRNIFEGYLIYSRLSATEIETLERHFAAIGKPDDIIFWKYLCLRLFDAQEFSGAYSFVIKAKYFFHSRFGQSPKINGLLYSAHFVYRLLFKDLWSAPARQTLSRKISNPQTRKIFWQKITRVFRR